MSELCDLTCCFKLEKFKNLLLDSETQHVMFEHAVMLCVTQTITPLNRPIKAIFTSFPLRSASTIKPCLTRWERLTQTNQSVTDTGVLPTKQHFVES